MGDGPSRGRAQALQGDGGQVAQAIPSQCAVPPIASGYEYLQRALTTALFDVSTLGAVVVKYTATESGGTHALELPDPITAYLTMSDVEPGTLIMP